MAVNAGSTKHNFTLIAKNLAVAFVGPTKLNYGDLYSCQCSGTNTAAVCVGGGLNLKQRVKQQYHTYHSFGHA